MASTEPEHEHREEEEALANEDEDTAAQVAPIVKLEEIVVTTDEEDETSILRSFTDSIAPIRLLQSLNSGCSNRLLIR